jgi:hypothetical protein
MSPRATGLPLAVRPRKEYAVAVKDIGGPAAVVVLSMSASAFFASPIGEAAVPSPTVLLGVRGSFLAEASAGVTVSPPVFVCVDAAETRLSCV